MIRLIALILLLPSIASGSGYAPPRPAVCRVAVEERDGEAYGSGALIDARDQYGLVVTNWHVVRDATGRIEVRFPGGFKSEARPLKLDETWDLAALVVWRPPVEPVPLAARPPQPGERLTICGYGQGDYLEQTGRCTDYYSPEIGQPQELVELNVQARQGDSGGPILNTHGEVAGVLFGAARGATLGSFGGRVQTFLATLAPDIGARARAPQVVAHGSGPAGAPASTDRAVDPFLAAERAANGPHSPVVAPSVAAGPPPKSLADVPASNRPALARGKGEAWISTPIAQGSVGFAPHRSGIASPASPPPGLDWYEDSRTILAVLGAAALVVSCLRMTA